MTIIRLAKNLNGSSVASSSVTESSRTATTSRLQAFTDYFLELKAKTNGGTGPSSTVFFKTLPSTPEAGPRNVTITNVTDTNITISWSPLPNNADIYNDWYFLGYTICTFVYYNRASGSFFKDFKTSNTTTSLDITGLQPFMWYKLKVSAYTRAGDGKQTVMCVRTMMSSPRGIVQEFEILNTTESSLTIRIGGLFNKKEHGPITHYIVTYINMKTKSKKVHPVILIANNSLECNSSARTTHDCTVAHTFVKTSHKVVTTIENLYPITKYEFWARSCNPCGCTKQFFTEKTVSTDEGVPVCFPSNITVTNVTSTKFAVNWTAMTPECIRGILIYIKLTYSHCTNVVIPRYFGKPLHSCNTSLLVKNDSTSAEVLGLLPYTNYSFILQAFTRKGGGPTSNVTSILTDEDKPDAPPLNIHATAVSSTTIMINMSKPPIELANGVIQGYQVMYRWNKVSTINQTIIFNRNTTITHILVRLRKYAVYQIVLAAFTSAGLGPWSNSSWIRTNEDIPSGAPLNLNVSSITNTSSVISWDDIEEDRKQGIIIAYKVISQAQFLNNTVRTKLDTNLSSHVHNISIQDLLPYTYGYFRIAGCTKLGCGPNVTTEFFTLEEVPSVAPLNISGENTSSTSIFVQWKQIPEMTRNGIITSYNVSWVCVTENKEVEIPKDIKHKQYESTVINDSNITWIHLKHLKHFSWYHIIVSVGNTKGYGPLANCTVKTREDVPGASPTNVSAYNMTSSSIMVCWDFIPYLWHRGILKGYIIYFGESSFYDNFTVIRNTSITSHLLTNLSLFTEYNISIAGFTSKGVGVKSEPIFAITNNPVHGNWSVWSTWTSCTTSCGGGKQWRERTCTDPVPADAGEDCVGHKNEIRDCSLLPCSGRYLAQPGKDCEETCRKLKFACFPSIQTKDSKGIFTDLYDVQDFTKNASLQCNTTSETEDWKHPYNPSYHIKEQICAGFKSLPRNLSCIISGFADSNIQPICNCLDPKVAGFSPWSEWGSCTKSCGRGTKKRFRYCVGQGNCDGLPEDVSDCNVDPCPVDGCWSGWTIWGTCSKTCGNGNYYRYRYCNNPKPAYGGKDCEGTISKDKRTGCNTQPCPIHGQWGSWGQWSFCSQPCGGGNERRYRNCDNPKPMFNGEYCKGLPVDMKKCNTTPCAPVNVECTGELMGLKWDYKMVYKNGPEFKAVARNISNACSKVYEGNPDYEGTVLNCLHKGSVIANFSVLFKQSSSDQLIKMMDEMETQNSLGSLPLKVMHVSADTVPASTFRAVSLVSNSPTTIDVSWSNFDEGNDTSIQMYFLFYKKDSISNGSWHVQGTNETQVQLQRLLPYTVYSLRIVASSTSGNGLPARIRRVITQASVPSVAPPNARVEISRPTEAYFEWDEIPLQFRNGPLKYYRITIRKYYDNETQEVDVLSSVHRKLITNLRPFTLYYFELMGVTTAGKGELTVFTKATPQGPPGVHPAVTVLQKYSINELKVSWTNIQEGKRNGIILGFNIRWKAKYIAGEPVIGPSPEFVREVDAYTFSIKITDLKVFTTYLITVAAFTEGGEGPTNPPILADTCKCPSELYSNWYQTSPYVDKSGDTKLSGVFPRLLKGMVQTVCTGCSYITKLNLFKSRSGHHPERKSEKSVKETVSSDVHLSFPIFGKIESTTFNGEFDYIMVSKSSGSVIIIRDEKKHSSGIVDVLSSVIHCWPILLLSILMAYLSGILVWGLEQFVNPDEFKQGSFLIGSMQGFWWAFVTMTTVGYGDITPRSFLAKLIAMVWIMSGLIMVGILTGSISTNLTTLTMPQAVKLYGTKTAALPKSYESELAIRRNAEVTEEYHSVKSILDALVERKVDAALIDVNVAASHAKKVKELGLQMPKMVPSHSGYGLVLSGEMKSLAIDVRRYVALHQFWIDKYVLNHTRGLEFEMVSTTHVNIFNPESATFQELFLGSIILVVCSYIFGFFCWFVCRRCRRKKVTPLSDHKEQLYALEELYDVVGQFKSQIKEKTESLHNNMVFERVRLITLKKNFERWQRRMGTRARGYKVAVESLHGGSHATRSTKR